MSKCVVQPKSEVTEHIKRWPTDRAKTWTINFIDTAKGDDNIMAVVAIGSAVRRAVPSVDLDLITICRDSAKLKAKSPLEIDLRVYRAGEVNEEIARGNDLLGWAVKFGQVIFQREGYWDTVAESFRDNLPLPSANLFEKRAKEAHTRLCKVFEVGDMDAAHEQALSYVTHIARTELLKQKVYPASRPELPEQLRGIGCNQVAELLEKLMDSTADHTKLIIGLVNGSRKINC